MSAPLDLLARLLAHPERIDPRAIRPLDTGALVREAERQHVVPPAAQALDAIDASTPAAVAMHAAAAAWALRERGEREAVRAFLDAASRSATRVAIAEGERPTQDLQTQEVR